MVDIGQGFSVVKSMSTRLENAHAMMVDASGHYPLSLIDNLFSDTL